MHCWEERGEVQSSLHWICQVTQTCTEYTEWWEANFCLSQRCIWPFTSSGKIYRTVRPTAKSHCGYNLVCVWPVCEGPLTQIMKEGVLPNVLTECASYCTISKASDGLTGPSVCVFTPFDFLANVITCCVAATWHGERQNQMWRSGQFGFKRTPHQYVP